MKNHTLGRVLICALVLLGVCSDGGSARAQLGGGEKFVPVLWNNGKVFFLQGSQYARYDVANDKADDVDGNGASYPRPIQGNWPGLFTENIDAGVLWPAPPPGGGTPKTVAYFFKGNQFMRYDVEADQADAADGAGRAYPQPIALKWPGIWTDRVDAVLAWPVPKNGRTVAYFFRDDQYIRFDVVKHRADPGYPKPIAGNWPNFKFPGGIDGAVAWPNKIEGKSVVYFFKGDQYMRYDVGADRAEDQSEGGLDYPAPVAGSWPGLLVATGPGGGGQQVEIEINQTAVETDDYLTWAPNVSRARIKPGTAQGNPLTVVLTNDPPPAITGGGDVVFAAAQNPWPANTTATADSLTLTLPSNNDWVPFVVAGKFGKPSTNDKDAVIDIHRDTATGAILSSKAVMVRIRKNANTLRPAERDRFLEAMRQLRLRGQYVVFQEMHRLSATAGDESHGQPAFLPWHRAFILQVERALQAIDPSVAIPYWNWDEASPRVFHEDFMGAGAGPAAGFTAEPIFSTTNPLNMWPTELPFSGGRISRRTFDQTVAPSSSANPQPFHPLVDITGAGGGLVDLPDYGPRAPDDVAANPTFSVVVERMAHDLGHSWNCGSGHLMNPVTSAAEPLFYLLHGQVDREWAFWQQRRGRHGVASSGSVSFPAPIHYDNGGTWNSLGVGSWQMGSFVEDTMWPWDGTTGPQGPGSRDDRPVNQSGGPGDGESPVNLPSSRPAVPRTPFPQSPIGNLWPAVPISVKVRDVIDYLGKLDPNNCLGYSYDDVPY